ncbi:unnamed protein product, partial [Tetraodon nigroviridis]
SDLNPVDLLSFVLEKDPSKLVPNVQVKQAMGVRGVRFSGPHTSMSFASSQLLTNCELLPQNVSIVVTLKISSGAAKVSVPEVRLHPKVAVRSDLALLAIIVTLKFFFFVFQKNEYIFTLMEPRKLQKMRVSNLEKGRTVERKQGRDKEAKKDREKLILGLRLSQNRLHFFFKSSGGTVENCKFRSSPLDDNRWHTLVLAVNNQRVSLTVDCGAPLEIFPTRHFPSGLSFQGSKFHIGSKGKWKGLFSGLLRQLVLLPGSDATHHICPSSTPQLAALSVPPLLSDAAHPGSDDDEQVIYHTQEEKVSVGLQRSCTEQIKGQLWFNPLRKGLYLCDGTTWIAVLEDHKRLDYLLEYQVLTTSSETHDIEVFQVPGVGLMAAMAHRSTFSGSAVYIWNHTSFQLYQNISTYGALAWRHFIMGKKTFLVVSNSGGEPGKHYKQEKRMDFSVIYKWSRKRKQFVRVQTLQTYCARDWEAFKINRQTYLAVANHRKGKTENVKLISCQHLRMTHQFETFPFLPICLPGDNNHTIDSVIYKWNRLTKSFEVHQLLPTSGAYDWEYFTVGPYHFLVVANAFDGMTTSVDSVIYVWINGSFQVFQTIKTFCATDWEMFQIGSRIFLAVANGHKLQASGPSQYAINSTIYELDMMGQMFVRFQDILTYSAVDWEFFSLGENHFLIVANSFNGESYSLNSILYRWQGYEGFVPVHWLPTIGCSDWEYFNYQGEAYLIYSSAKAPLSKVFKLKN